MKRAPTKQPDAATDKTDEMQEARKGADRGSADLSQAMDLAQSAAREAGKILKSYFRKAHSYRIGSKGRDNPVTTADLEADQALKEILTGGFPGWGWLSEESTDDRARLRCRRVWIVDPLDGTKEFIRGIPEFSVAIALVEGGVAVLGVTYNPIKDELFWAARAMGCYLGNRRVRVTPTREIKEATVLASRSEAARGEWEVFHGRLKVSPTGSVAYKLAMVAAGKADATFSRSPKSEWDIASGAALLGEAGGRMTDIAGNEIRFNQPKTELPGVIASNGLLHAQLLRLAKSRGQRARAAPGRPPGKVRR